MKNYAEMSDFEINSAVASALGVDFEAHETGVYASVKWLGDNVVSVAGIVDYCNNWADAGPVMLENRISLLLADDSIAYAYSKNTYDEFGCLEGYEFEAEHKNPLRAAMIVFLMMKDEEK